MHDRDIIPIQPLTGELAAQLVAAPVLAKLPATVPTVAYRAPAAMDDKRWRTHTIGERNYRIAQPVTFTPYASAKPCSARCRFCSESLIEKAATKPSSSLRPGSAYFDNLRAALRELAGLPISYSLSGLETTDDPEWMRQMLDALQRHAESSPVNDRVLYTNGSGLAHAAHGAALIERLAAFGLDWVELSRHHHREDTNQSIMRFRSGVEVRQQERFAAMLQRLSGRMPVKLVCIVQAGGVATAGDALDYLGWARNLGVEAVVFREFSQLDDSYRDNVTSRYIAGTRIPMAGLLEQCLNQPEFATQFGFEQVTEGYYFWNLIGRYRGMRVTFEASDYALMHRQHGSGNVYKLVFHANGNLCAGWNPERHILFSSAREEALIG
ncbi:radical SAM protein [Massilia sp. YIM B04103]|uniref:radical SAM protein n=1 Tax=Massilia sp. YIM B04103 TaxID=2963106 RepID=UPI0021092803|nr:radical SAM protein [Massilia sp. YIM B04103]